MTIIKRSINISAEYLNKNVKNMTNKKHKPGLFISFEGIDGAGKSTHIRFVQSILEQRGIQVVSSREPGGTPLGETLRSLLLTEKMHLETEALLMFASRREHIAQVILVAQAGNRIATDLARFGTGQPDGAADARVQTRKSGERHAAHALFHIGFYQGVAGQSALAQRLVQVLAHKQRRM